MTISSMYTPIPWPLNSSKSPSTNRWKVAGALQRPKGMTTKLIEARMGLQTLFFLYLLLPSALDSSPDFKSNVEK